MKKIAFRLQSSFAKLLLHSLNCDPLTRRATYYLQWKFISKAIKFVIIVCLKVVRTKTSVFLTHAVYLALDQSFPNFSHLCTTYMSFTTSLYHLYCLYNSSVKLIFCSKPNLLLKETLYDLLKQKTSINWYNEMIIIKVNTWKNRDNPNVHQ